MWLVAACAQGGYVGIGWGCTNRGGGVHCQSAAALRARHHIHPRCAAGGLAGGGGRGWAGGCLWVTRAARLCHVAGRARTVVEMRTSHACACSLALGACWRGSECAPGPTSHGQIGGSNPPATPQPSHPGRYTTLTWTHNTPPEPGWCVQCSGSTPPPPVRKLGSSQTQRSAWRGSGASPHPSQPLYPIMPRALAAMARPREAL
jgi:hypothetical protein